MPQITQCPHCRGQLQVRDENLGQTIRCPLCQGLFKIAAPQAPSPPPPAVNVEVIEPPAPAPSPPPPPPPPAPSPTSPKPRPSGAASKPVPKSAPKPATKPAPKTRPTPAPSPPTPAKAEQPRRRKPPAEAPAPAPPPPPPHEEENPFAPGGPLAGALGGEPAPLNFEGGEAKPHRGNMVLGLGVAGLVLSLCCFPAGFLLGGCATVMGSRDLSLMARRRMDRAGKGPTRAGKILGIVAIVFSVINVAVTVWRVFVYFSA